MAEPTLKDVLNAVANLEARFEERLDAVDSRFDSVDARFDAVEAKVDAHRAETKKAFEALDDELSDHVSIVHRRIDKDIDLLKRRLPGARPAQPPRRRRRPRA